MADDVFAAGLVCKENSSVRGVMGEKEESRAMKASMELVIGQTGKSVVGFSRPR